MKNWNWPIIIYFLVLCLLAGVARCNAQEREPLRIPETRLVDVPMLYMWTGAAADFTSTRILLRHPEKFQEANPMLGNNWKAQAGIMGGTTLMQTLVARNLKRQGHPKAARVLCYIVGSIHYGAAAWNIQLGIRN